jgi:hypothetical protein
MRDNVMKRVDKLILRAGLAAITLAAFSSAPARATTYVVTYTGKVAISSLDTGGFFGDANASLAGLSFIAKFVADDATIGSRYASGSDFTTLFGGPGLPDGGPPPPILPGTSISPVKATLTIKGITQRFGDINPFIGVVQKRDNLSGGADSLSTQVHDRPVFGNGNSRYLQIAIFSTTNNIFGTSAFSEFVDRALIDGDQFNSFFSLVNADSNGFSSGSVSGTFSVSSVNFATLSAAVPEPANWALMIAGFGLVGGALRNANLRRKQTVKVSYAA